MATGKLAKRYDPVQLLGSGAMGEVWLVEDTLLGDRLAMKIISKDLASKDKSLLQFKQEFHLMTQLRHANCCEVFDFGQLPDGSPYFTMEYVPGEPPGANGPLAPEALRSVLSQLLMALGHLHRLELVHRDIKRDNVRVKPDGTVKLMDYGLMEYAGRAGGGLTGTFPYLPPEVVLQGPVDQRSDLYSVGVLAYELLAGRLPFERARPLEILKAHVSERPERPSRLRPGIDAGLEQVVLKLLEKDPVDRYQTAYEVLGALGVEVPSGLGGHLLSSPLIGHEGARATLAEQLARVGRGEPGDVLILTGATGLGKSRLTREFRYTAQLEGLPCSHAACREHGQSPYDPVIATLRGLLPAFKEHVRAELDRHAPVLVKLLPELMSGGTGQLPVLPAPDIDSPLSEKQRLQGAVVELMGALAQVRPFVVILDDVQWADPLSVELFNYLRRVSPGWPIGILLSSREVPEVATRGTGRLLHLPLFPLSRPELARMVSAMLGTSAIAPAFLDQVETLSQGNPLFTERLLEHLVQAQILVNDGGWDTEVLLTTDRLPATLQALLLTRIRSLPPEAEALARVVSVAGRPTGIDLLKQVAEFSEVKLFHALETLLLQHVLVQTAQGDYGFAQDQFQQVIYESLEPGVRIPLHAKIASALEQQIADVALGEVAMDLVMAIATHHMLASDAQKTIRFALEAGVRNANLLAPAIARSFLRAGFEVLERLDDPLKAPERLEYLRRLGDVSRMLGDFEDARDQYLEALPLAQEAGALWLYGRMATSLAKAYQCLAAYPDALEWAKRSRATCGAAGDATGAARAHLTSARLSFYTGQVASAVGHALRALELARSVDDRIQVGQALAYLGYLRVTQQGQVAEGLAALNEAFVLLEETGDKLELLYAQMLAGDAHAALGDLLAAQEAFNQALRLSEAMDNAADRCGALLNLANVALELGQYRAAVAAATEAVASAEQLQDRYMAGISEALAAAGYRHLGEYQAAQEGMARAVALASALNNPYMAVLVGQHALELEFELGRLPAARAWLDGLAARLTGAENAEQETRLDIARAFVLARMGDWASAREAAERALVAAEAAEARYLQALALHAHAWLALQAGRLDDARDDARQAWAIATRIHAQGLVASLHGVLGEVALATGRGNAGAHFQAMLEITQSTGAPLLSAQALFGQAASAPYGAGALDAAARAKALLTGLTATFDEAGRALYLTAVERLRIWEGNHIAFSLPVAKTNDASGRLRPGLWRLE